MINWIAAYNRLYKFLDGYSGSQFIKVVQSIDPDLLSYNDYIQSRRNEEKSTTKKDYFRDIILSYNDDIKHLLFEMFIERVEQDNPDEIKDIRTILGGNNVDIRKAIYAKALASKEVDENLLEQTIYGLEKYPDTLKLYKQALIDFNNGRNQRRVLDDLRLSVEVFLKEILGNDKSLENQVPFLGKFQKEKSISPEIFNTFRQLIDLFSKYQNAYVKHNDEVKPNEIEFVFNLTNTLYRFILSH